MKIVIVEDEKPAARRLNRMLQQFNYTAEALLHSVEEAVIWFQKNPHPDLILLDIQLSDGLSFEIFKKVTIKSAVIFTTAYDEYALQAFKLNSIDYLLKPIDTEELELAITKFKERIPEQKDITLNFEAIKKMLVNPIEREYKKRFTVKVGQHLKMIDIDTIECIYSENKGTYLHTTEGRCYLIDSTLEQLENDLDPKSFFRISRKFYININEIQDIISYTNSRLQIKLKTYTDSEVIVSRDRVRDFKYWIS